MMQAKKEEERESSEIEAEIETGCNQGDIVVGKTIETRDWG